MVRIDFSKTIFLCCLCIPILVVLGAPAAEETLKQQIASGLFRGNNGGYWSENAMGPGGQSQMSRQQQQQALGQLRRLSESFPYGNLPFNNGYQKKSPFDSLSGSTFGTSKRNFDEIDRSGGFGSFVKKNFDEIDRVGLGFTKKNFDEIDRSGGFGSFVKRA